LFAAEFRVLLPEIGFDDFGRGQEAKDGCITGGQGSALLFSDSLVAQESGGGEPDARGAYAFEEGSPAANFLDRLVLLLVDSNLRWLTGRWRGRRIPGFQIAPLYQWEESPVNHMGRSRFAAFPSLRAQIPMSVISLS
jgi:hypothetical protein